MMKRFVWIGLVTLVLAVVAAQCGAGAQPADAPGNQAAEEEPAAQAAPAEEESTNEEASAAQAESAADESAQPEEAAEEVAEEASETEEAAAEEADTTAQESAESEEAASESESAAADEEEPAAQADSHSPADCEDPFAGVENIRFSADIWNAERISRFVGPELVDPSSNLETNFCKHSIDYSEILSGGPPPDGIPPIDDPNFDSIATGDEWLADVQPVISLVVGDEARAYPLAILTRHEIVNDEIGGMPVAVTFCPLCNTGVVYNREVNGQVLRFGVSGNLRNSDLVMWDNKTLSWWQQFTGQAIVGEMTGTQLEVVPAQMVAWKDFKEAYPEGVVLSNNGRPYGQNPYAGYDSSSQPFLYRGEPDPRLPALQRVLGYQSGETAKAYPLPMIAEEGVIEDTINGQDVVIFYAPGQVSALDKGVIEDSKEVGSAAMFSPVVDGETLTFSYNDGVITDDQTGSQWNIFGEAISGELEGTQLEKIQGRVDFWFAWAAFWPDTEVYST